MPKVCSELLSTVYEGHLWSPPSKPLPCTMESSFHLSLWPDKALTLTENLMSPYSGCGLSHKQKIFHYRLSHARRVLLSCIQLYVENVFKMELVCCVLHIAVYSIMYYMIRREAPFEFAPPNLAQDVQFMDLCFTAWVKSIRNQFTNIFVSPEHEVSWQT